VWEIVLDLSPGMHAYKFVVNGTDWTADPFANDFTDDGFGGQNSMLLLGEEAMVAGEPEGYVPDASGAGDSAGLTAEPSGTEVTFRFRPGMKNVNAVSLAGTFNDWDAAAHPMTDDEGDGLWEVILHLPPGEHAYQFVVDGDRWFTDKFAPDFEEDLFGGRNALISVGADRAEAGSPVDRIPR